jgi:hypothetical protein
VFFLCSRTGSNQAFCDDKKWFGVAKFARRNVFREQTSGEGFSRYPVSGAKVITKINRGEITSVLLWVGIYQFV